MIWDLGNRSTVPAHPNCLPFTREGVGAIVSINQTSGGVSGGDTGEDLPS